VTRRSDETDIGRVFALVPYLFSSLSLNAQQARMWLTTPDWAALVTPQASSLQFSSEAGQLPVLTVDDCAALPNDGLIWFCSDGRKRAAADANGRCATDGLAENPIRIGNCVPFSPLWHLNRGRSFPKSYPRFNCCATSATKSPKSIPLLRVIRNIVARPLGEASQGVVPPHLKVIC
jgi:hypothetical protein